MRIEIERTGGFAGMRMHTVIDTETLPSEQAKEVESMVDAAGFFELAAKVGAPPSSADRFNYKISIEAEGQKYTVETSDEVAPDTLRPLLRRLMVLARSGGRSHQ